MWENAYSSLKNVERPINLCVILFDNHSCFNNQFFYSKYILGDVLDKHIQKFEKDIFCKKLYFALECIYSFLPFIFWYLVSSL